MPLARATWLTAEKFRCFAGSLPNFTKWPNFGSGWPSDLRRARARRDHERYIVGVAVDRYAAFDDAKGQSFGFQVGFVGAHKSGELCPRGMAHDEQTTWIAAKFGDVVVNPVNRPGDVAHDGFHIDLRQEPIVRGDKDETLFPRRPRAWLARSTCRRLPSHHRGSRRPRGGFWRFRASRRRASDARWRAGRREYCV